MAERAGAEADRCSRGPDHRGKGRQRNCAAQIPQDCECEPQVNFRRRHFLRSSLLVFCSTLMDSLTTPLWRSKRPLLPDTKTDSSTEPVKFDDVANESVLNVPNVWGSD